MSTFTPEILSQILDNLPNIVMRLVYKTPKWRSIYINKAVERYGYGREDFVSGRMAWDDLLHPDDRVLAMKLADDYMKSNVDEFKLQYRIVAKGGKSIYITEYSHVNRNPDGTQGTIDSFLFEDLETQSSNAPEADALLRRNLALNDILLTLLDARSDPEMAIQHILDRAGAFLDCSRALLFKDSPDHKTCKVVYEWLNHDITSIKDLDYAVTYATEMPEIYVALQKTGVLLVNGGEIPENCKEEFEAEGLISSAIFAIYQYGDHYGFVCFDDCIISRRWDPEMANFLKVVANLLSNVVMHLQSARYVSEYEDKIKTLAFRDYMTGLPNHYSYDSDFADAIMAASDAGVPGHAVMLSMNDIDAIRNTRGLTIVNGVGKQIASELQDILRDALGERGTLYRIAGTVFAVLAQPDAPADAVRAFAERASERCRSPWRTDAGEFACLLNVAAIPFGVKNRDLEKITGLLDAALVKSSCSEGHGVVFVGQEE